MLCYVQHIKTIQITMQIKMEKNSIVTFQSITKLLTMLHNSATRKECGQTLVTMKDHQ